MSIEHFKNQDEEALKILCDESQFEDAEYQGKSVTLNKPFRTPGEKKKFAVYAKNSRGSVVKVRFGDPDMEIKRDDPEAKSSYRARHKCDIQKDKSTPAYWSCRMWGGTSVSKITDSLSFNQKVFFDMNTKKIRSVRDGVQEYSGLELGIEPYDRTFTVYRSPETISAIAGDLDNLPIINDHIDPSTSPTKDQIIGLIGETDVVEFEDQDTDSTLALENKVSMSDKFLRLKDSGKVEFSLGYLGKMKEHETYDFEQFDICVKNGHLALVDAARGGSQLTFVDKKVTTMHKAFLDADGNVSIGQVFEIAQSLAEHLREMTPEQIAKIAPVLVEMQSAAGKEMAGPEMTDEDKEQYREEGKEEIMDTEYEDMEEEDKKKFGDSKLFKSIISSQGKKFSDSAEFKDALSRGIKEAVADHSAVVEKAREFLPENYSFADSDTVKIMRDAIATQNKSEFKDSEISVAFKMLSKSGQYHNFGDSQTENEFDKIGQKDY